MKQGLIVKSAISAAILATLAGCATAPQHEWEADKTYKLTVLHTNDHHGRFCRTNMASTAWLLVRR